jgi:putative pre-16S rRNA nuclease
MSIAAIDFGRRRIGIAVADPEGISIRPLEVLERTSLAKDLNVLRARFVENGITRLVVGLPLNMDGTAGSSASAAEEFARRLGAFTGLPVELHDERLTTFEAIERLRAMGGRNRTLTGLDAIAAAIILESWFSSRSRPSRA